MAKIAIDVALLPPEDIMDKAIEINSQVSGNPINLNKENCLPHITLFMGVVEEDGLSELKKRISEVASQFSKMSLRITGLNSDHCAFDIELTENLQKLHETLMARLTNYLAKTATVDVCFSPPPVVEKTLSWISGYKDNSSLEKFYPHITLGVSKIEEKELKIDFIASKLALCHLGNYCTCRKILSLVDLN